MNMTTKGKVSAKYKLKNEEMETHLSIDLVDKKWNCWTTIKKDMTKMQRQGWKLVKTECYTDGTVYSKTFEAPENAITFRSIEDPNAPKSKRKPRKPMTEEQKEKMRQGRLAKKEAEKKNS